MRSILLIFLFLALPAFAHETGPSVEVEVGEYLIDIGYSTFAPQADEVVLFDFGLTREEAAVSFDDVWVRIESEEGVVFASGIHNAPFGGARMSYRFPEGGTYTVATRFENVDGTLAETSFELEVAPSTLEIPPYLFGFAGLILGGVATVIFLRRRRA